MASTYEFDSLKNSVDRLYDWLENRDFKIHSNWTMDDLIEVHRDVEELGQKVSKLNALYRRNVMRPLVEEGSIRAGQKMADLGDDADPMDVMKVFKELKLLQSQMSDFKNEDSQQGSESHQVDHSQENQPHLN